MCIDAQLARRQEELGVKPEEGSTQQTRRYRMREGTGDRQDGDKGKCPRSEGWTLHHWPSSAVLSDQPRLQGPLWPWTPVPA